jgi:phage baseplate assembly protein gpV
VQVQKNSIALTQDGSSITLSGGNVTITGTLIINGQAYLAHEHTGVKAGSDTSGGVA